MPMKTPVEWDGDGDFWFADVDTPGDAIELAVHRKGKEFTPSAGYSSEHTHEVQDVCPNLGSAQRAAEAQAAKLWAQEVERVGRNMAEVDLDDWPIELVEAARDRLVPWRL